QPGTALPRLPVGSEAGPHSSMGMPSTEKSVTKVSFLPYFRSLHWAWWGATMPSSAPPHPSPHHRFPSQMISHAFWLFLHCSFSHRDVEALLYARGMIVSSIAICTWGHTGGASCTPPWLRRPRPGHTWHLAKVCITLNTVQEAHARHCSRAQMRGRAACRCSPAHPRRAVGQ